MGVLGSDFTRENRQRLHLLGVAGRWFLTLAMGLVLVSNASALDLRLRIAWGGGAASQWSGRISLTEGHFSQLKSLGLEPDTPGLVHIVQNTIPIHAPSPRRYQAIDVSVDAPTTAILMVELHRQDRPQEQKQLRVPLAELVTQPSSHPIDLDQNRLLIRRSPGDRVRVDLHRDHLVFRASEPWQIDVTPHALGTQADALELRAQLFAARSTKQLWRTQQEIPQAASGEPQTLRDLQIPIPAQPGVYDLALNVVQPSRRSLRAATPLASRRVQFVVAPTGEVTTGEVRTLFEINPAEARWWNSLRSLSPLTGALRRFRMEAGAMKPVRVGELAMGELAPASSQTFSLPVESPGKLHRLTIQYPRDREQRLRLTLADRQDDGEFVAMTDTVLMSDPRPAGSDDAVGVYEVAFWPQSQTVKLVLTNQRVDSVARIGSLRLAEGGAPDRGREQTAGRAVLAQFGIRLPLQFNATSGVDSESAQKLTDWQTFYEAAVRAAEAVRLGGYTGAIVTVVDDGTALYPSRLLDATPQADTGAYFNEGHDPIRKDVVELLFRVFEEEGLQLVPRFCFNAPLPALERLPTHEHRLTPSNRLSPTAQAMPRYDVAVDLVQQAMHEVVREFVERYQHHPSFSGVALELAPDSYTLLPNLDWGYSQPTIAGFCQRQAIDAQLTGREISPSLIARLRRGDLAEAWRQYRVERVTQFYQRLAALLPQRSKPMPVYLMPEGLSTNAQFVSATTPAIAPERQLTDLLADMGLSAAQLQPVPGLTLCRPIARCLGGDRGVPTATTAALETRFDHAFADSARHGVTIFHDHRAAESIAAHAAKIDNADPTARETIRLPRPPVPRCTDSDQRRELAQVLARFDSAVMMLDEGATPPVDSMALRSFTETVAALPQVPFEPVEGGPAAVMVRTCVHATSRYVYAVNDTPWPMVVTLELEGDVSQFALLGDPVATQWTATEGGGRLTTELAAYSLVAARVGSVARIARVDAQPPATIVDELKQQIAGLITRTKYFKQPLPMAWLRDPGFEGHRLVDGTAWSGSPESPHSLAPDDRVAHNGQRSMRLSRPDDKYVWMRSVPLPAPPFGRLMVQAWARFDPRYPDARLRICVEGQHQGQPYYRFATINARDVAEPDQWIPCVLRIDDLPTEDLSELRLRFDMLTPGVVWIDDVSVFDRAFTLDEQKELAKIIALADLQLRDGDVRACYHTLSGYWPRYVEQVVPDGVVRVARAEEEERRNGN